MSISPQQFAFLRRSHPAAAFDAVVKDLLLEVENDPEIAEVFASFQKNFKGKITTPESAVRLAALRDQGAEQLDIKVGVLPWELSAGLAFMYDTAVEGLRTSETHIDPKLFGTRAIRTAEHLLEPALLEIGASAVTALEIAMVDRDYADKLRERAGEIGWAALDNPPDPTLCEHCSVTIEDDQGNVSITCPSEEACNRLGGIIIILVLIWLAVKIIDWLWD